MLNQVIVGTTAFNIDSVDPDEILIITSISGLDPADVTLFTGDFARDGGYYQGRRTGKRNPVITFKINEDYVNSVSTSDIRELLYRLFFEPQPDSDGVTVTLKDDKKPDRFFTGYTEKIQSDIFVNRPTAQVSMICVDPYIKSVTPVNFVDGSGALASTPIAYDGSADVGIEASFKVKTATPTVTMNLNGKIMQLTLASGNFAVNDVIHINTNMGSRFVRRNELDIMAALTSTSEWFQLNQPNNTLSAYGTVAGDGKMAVSSYTYQSNWWGI